MTQIDAETFARLGAPLLLRRRRACPTSWRRLDPAGAERLRAALASRVTWSGLTLDLPVADGGRVCPWC